MQGCTFLLRIQSILVQHIVVGILQVARYDDPQEAAISLVVESYRLWLSYETRTDDITAIVIMLETIDERVLQTAPS